MSSCLTTVHILAWKVPYVYVVDHTAVWWFNKSTTDVLNIATETTKRKVTGFVNNALFS